MSQFNKSRSVFAVFFVTVLLWDIWISVFLMLEEGRWFDPPTMASHKDLERDWSSLPEDVEEWMNSGMDLVNLWMCNEEIERSTAKLEQIPFIPLSLSWKDLIYSCAAYFKNNIIYRGIYTLIDPIVVEYDFFPK